MLCWGACRLEAIGPELPVHVRDADGRHWTLFNSLYYAYVDGRPVDVTGWRWLARPFVAVDFAGAPVL